VRQTGERRAERQKETERQRGSVQQPRPLWEVDVPPYYHSSFLRLARGHSVGGGTRGGQGRGLLPPREGIFCDCCCLLLYCRTYVKAVRGGWSEEEGRVLWDATSRGLCGRVGPPRTNVRVLLCFTRADVECCIRVPRVSPGVVCCFVLSLDSEP